MMPLPQQGSQHRGNCEGLPLPWKSRISATKSLQKASCFLWMVKWECSMIFSILNGESIWISHINMFSWMNNPYLSKPVQPKNGIWPVVALYKIYKKTPSHLSFNCVFFVSLWASSKCSKAIFQEVDPLASKTKTCGLPDMTWTTQTLTGDLNDPKRPNHPWTDQQTAHFLLDALLWRPIIFASSQQKSR